MYRETVFLDGEDLTDERIRVEIKRKATRKSQGAWAVLTKKDDSVEEVFLIIDNNLIVIGEGSGTKDFVRSEVRLMKI